MSLTFLIFIMACCKTSLRICETESCQPFSHLTTSLVHSVHTSCTRSLGTLQAISPWTYKQQNYYAQINSPRYQHRTPINTFRFSDLTCKKAETSAFRGRRFYVMFRTWSRQPRFASDITLTVYIHTNIVGMSKLWHERKQLKHRDAQLIQHTRTDIMRHCRKLSWLHGSEPPWKV